MLKRYKLAGLLLLSLSLSLNLSPALAAPKSIESFDAHSWQRFQKELSRPAAVVFSSTDCAHCPGVIAGLAAQLKNRRPQIPLIVVVMDGAEQPDLLQEAHYRDATRLFVFKGQNAQLQYSINPDWRGITPYVALLPQSGAMQLILGKPSSQEIAHWLNAIKKR